MDIFCTIFFNYCVLMSLKDFMANSTLVITFSINCYKYSKKSINKERKPKFWLLKMREIFSSYRLSCNLYMVCTGCIQLCNNTIIQSIIFRLICFVITDQIALFILVFIFRKVKYLTV